MHRYYNIMFENKNKIINCNDFIFIFILAFHYVHILLYFTFPYHRIICLKAVDNTMVLAVMCEPINYENTPPLLLPPIFTHLAQHAIYSNTAYAPRCQTTNKIYYVIHRDLLIDTSQIRIKNIFRIRTNIYNQILNNS